MFVDINFTSFVYLRVKKRVNSLNISKYNFIDESNKEIYTFYEAL